MNPFSCNNTLLPVYRVSAHLITSILYVNWNGLVQIPPVKMVKLDLLTAIHEARADWKFAKMDNGGLFQARDFWKVKEMRHVVCWASVIKVMVL